MHCTIKKLQLKPKISKNKIGQQSKTTHTLKYVRNIQCKCGSKRKPIGPVAKPTRVQALLGSATVDKRSTNIVRSCLDIAELSHASHRRHQYAA